MHKRINYQDEMRYNKWKAINAHHRIIADPWKRMISQGRLAGITRSSPENMNRVRWCGQYAGCFSSPPGRIQALQSTDCRGEARWEHIRLAGKDEHAEDGDGTPVG